MRWSTEASSRRGTRDRVSSFGLRRCIGCEPPPMRPCGRVLHSLTEVGLVLLAPSSSRADTRSSEPRHVGALLPAAIPRVGSGRPLSFQAVAVNVGVWGAS